MNRLFNILTMVVASGVLALAVGGCSNNGAPTEKKMDKMEGKMEGKTGDGKMSDGKMEGKMDTKMEGKMPDGRMEKK